MKNKQKDIVWFNNEIKTPPYKNIYWRIVYHLNIELNEIVILEIFNKKTGKTPQSLIDTCQKRLTYYYGKSLTRR